MILPKPCLLAGTDLDQRVNELGDVAPTREVIFARGLVESVWGASGSMERYLKLLEPVLEDASLNKLPAELLNEVATTSSNLLARMNFEVSDRCFSLLENYDEFVNLRSYYTDLERNIAGLYFRLIFGLEPMSGIVTSSEEWEQMLRNGLDEGLLAMPDYQAEEDGPTFQKILLPVFANEFATSCEHGGTLTPSGFSVAFYQMLSRHTRESDYGVQSKFIERFEEAARDPRAYEAIKTFAITKLALFTAMLNGALCYLTEYDEPVDANYVGLGATYSISECVNQAASLLRTYGDEADPHYSYVLDLNPAQYLCVRSAEL